MGVWEVTYFSYYGDNRRGHSARGVYFLGGHTMSPSMGPYDASRGSESGFDGLDA